MKKTSILWYKESRIGGIKEKSHKDSWTLISPRKVQRRPKSIRNLAKHTILFWNKNQSKKKNPNYKLNNLIYNM